MSVKRHVLSHCQLKRVVALAYPPATSLLFLHQVNYMRSIHAEGTEQAVAAEALYTEGPLSHEFPRTVSRLNEMQSAEFLALERRTVDTGLT